MDDDFDVDDILAHNKPTKKVNGCRKGKSVERQLCKVFNEQFEMESFSRSVGSGNRIH